MGDLARRRHARDLWISRSHLWALAAGTLVLSATAFGTGWALSERQLRSQPMRSPAITAGVPDDSLVALLSRVQTSAEPTAVVDELTFPDALTQETAGPVVGPVAPGEAPLAAVAIELPGEAAPTGEALIPAAPADLPTVHGDTPPNAAFTVSVGRWDAAPDARKVRDHLRSMGLLAWMSVERVDGDAWYGVAVGGFADEAAAAPTAQLLRGAGEGLQPAVVAIAR